MSTGSSSPSPRAIASACARTALLLWLISPVVAAQVPDLEFWPQGGAPGQDIFASNWVDHDPDVDPMLPSGPTEIQTHRCDPYSRDQHQGSDAGIKSFAEMDIGIPVFAVMDGLVCAANDIEHDRCGTNIEPVAACKMAYPCKSCGSNDVYIKNHGYCMQYTHLKKDSIPQGIAIGSCVRAGQLIGFTGSSGASCWPHIHFEIRDTATNETVDPFVGNCNPNPDVTWANVPPFTPLSTYQLFNVGVSRTDTGIRLPDRPPGGGWVQEDDQSVFVWGRIFVIPGNPTDLMFTVHKRGDPSNVVGTHQEPLTPERVFHVVINVDPGAFSDPGDWDIRIETSDGGLSRTIPFEVVAPGHQTNHAPKLPESVVISSASGTQQPDEALFCTVTMPELPDVDYNVLRFRYVWQDVTFAPTFIQILRDATHAGQRDAIPRQLAGRKIKCVVTVRDHNMSPGPMSSQTVTIAPGPTPPCSFTSDVCGENCAPRTPCPQPVRGWGRIKVDKRGALGQPELSARGEFHPGAGVECLLKKARPNSPAVWVVGTKPLGRRMFGGTLVPYPSMTFPDTIDAHGEANLPLQLPDNLRASLELYVQAWIVDPSATHGLAATDGLVGRSR